MAAIPPESESSVVAPEVAHARRELLAGRASAARRMLANLLERVPGNTQALRLMGVAAQSCGDHADAIDCFRKVMESCPPDAALSIRLGIALYMQGDFDEAVIHLQRGCELAPSSASGWFNLGEALKQRVERTQEAMAAFTRALDLDPAHIRARLSLARGHAGMGDVDSAIRAYREVLRHDSGNAWAWFGLSDLNTVRFDGDDVSRIRAAHACSHGADEAHNLLGFALAKALEHQGDYAQAFDMFRVANSDWRRHVQWDAHNERKRVEAIRQAFENWTPPQPVDPCLGHEVVLIVSMPRSGSSLVEHMLATHADVEGANEINDMPEVVRGETRRRQLTFPRWVSIANTDDWHRLGTQYLERTASWRKRKPRFTDKNLLTWQLVGAALAMLPAARVVVVRRDPLETCLACYRQRFENGMGFVYHLDDLADYCTDFTRLTRFWLQTYPNRVFDLEYETLVCKPEATLRRLLDFCGLSFDPACLASHKTRRAVMSTPSAVQVRQPLRQDTARAHRYGEKLDPLRRRLRDAGLLRE